MVAVRVNTQKLLSLLSIMGKEDFIIVDIDITRYNYRGNTSIWSMISPTYALYVGASLATALATSYVKATVGLRWFCEWMRT